MDSLIQLAIALGRLDHRVELLEKRESVNHIKFPEFSLENMEENEPERSASKMIQDGIDNIMGYTWPPKKDGEE